MAAREVRIAEAAQQSGHLILKRPLLVADRGSRTALAQHAIIDALYDARVEILDDPGVAILGLNELARTDGDLEDEEYRESLIERLVPNATEEPVTVERVKAIGVNGKNDRIKYASYHLDPASATKHRAQKMAARLGIGITEPHFATQLVHLGIGSEDRVESAIHKLRGRQTKRLFPFLATLGEPAWYDIERKQWV